MTLERRMVKSKFTFSYKLGVVGLVCTIIACCYFVFIVLIAEGPEEIAAPRENGRIAGFCIFLIILLPLFLIKDAIVVNVDFEKVVLRNWVTQKERRYLFSELQDFVQYVEPGEPVGIPDIYLLNDQKVFGKINSSHYKNVTELMEALEKGLSSAKSK
jgi:hypothetical protein